MTKRIKVLGRRAKPVASVQKTEPQASAGIPRRMLDFSLDHHTGPSTYDAVPNLDGSYSYHTTDRPASAPYDMRMEYDHLHRQYLFSMTLNGRRLSVAMDYHLSRVWRDDNREIARYVAVMFTDQIRSEISETVATLLAGMT
jgi:hypothetical protein